MKKILTTLILLISINSFSQEQQYEKVRNLYSNEKYEEAIPIIKDLLDNKYGKLPEISVFYLSYWIAASYENIENYSQATDKFNDYIELVNASDIFNKKTKKKLIKDVLIIIEELKFKMINSKKTEITSDTEIVVDTKAAEYKTPLNEISSTQDVEETVTLVVNSQGETVSDAKQNALIDVVDQTIVTVVTVNTGKSRSEAIKFALRDALEQSYGTFISSNTTIINDEISKDEIVSISSGNITNYEIISELQLPNGSYSVTISSQVSLKSFANYMQKKGHKVSFSGSKFSMNIKLLKLNEESEKKAINNMLIILDDLIKSCIDFEISGLPSAPALIPLYSNTMKNEKGEELYKVIIEVKWSLNENYKSFVDFLKESLRSISMKNSEIEEYLRLNKSTHEFFFYDQKNIVYPNDNIPDTFKPTKKYPINSYIGGRERRRFGNDERLDYQYSSARRSLFSKWWKENKILMESKYPPRKSIKGSLTYIKNPDGRKSSGYYRYQYDSIIGSFEKFIEREVYSKEDLAIEKMITHNTILNMNFTESETKTIFDPDFLKKLEYDLRVNDSTKVFMLISSYGDYQEKWREFLQGAGEHRVEQILASKGEGNINRAIRYNDRSRSQLKIGKIGEHTYLAADDTYKIDQFESGRLRGHEKLYFRNKETLKLISEFLFSNLDYLYDFNIKYGKNNFNPITLISRLLKNGGSDYRGGWSSSSFNYYPSNSVQFSPSTLGLPGTFFLSSNYMQNLDRDRSFSEVHFVDPGMYEAVKNFQTHTIAFYLTLKDLEKIDGFELVNNN
jgi:hypothetical protein